jgi:hypothetical protein
MKKRLISAAIVSVLIGLTLSSSPSEARRLFWWQNDDAQSYDVYSDDQDTQDAYTRDQFNQEQYDLYMKQTHRKKRLRYDQTYYDPQVDVPSVRPKLKKKKTVQNVALVKPSVDKKPQVYKPADTQTASIGKRFDTPAGAKSVDCSKGAAIVAGYGFSGVTTKSCTGSTFVYGASRSGKNFEIQMSSVSGELTAVKKL